MDKLAQLGIDPWSMLLYLVNTGVLIAVLTYYFYKPMVKFMDDRRAKIKGSIDEAQKLRDEFEKKLAEVEVEKKATEAEFKAELDRLQKFTDKKRAELVSEMEEARAKMMQKAQKEIDQKKASLLTEAEADVKRLMTRIILDIVENKVPENVIQDSIKASWKQYSK